MVSQYFRGLNIPKQLVYDVLEPNIPTVCVEVGYETRLKLMYFGSFELGLHEYIFGTEEAQYISGTRSKGEKFPIVIARVYNNSLEDPYFVMEPYGNFSKEEQDQILDAITYALESQRVATRYFVGCEA